MTFRDDLDAARQHIEALEQDLKESAAQAERREETLREQIRSLERTIDEGHGLSMQGLWAASWGPAIVVFATYWLAVLLAMNDKDGASWIVCQLSLATGIAGTLWSWGRVSMLWTSVVMSAIKALIVVVWSWGWWRPFYSELARVPNDPSFYFFWCAPVVLTFIVYIEGLLVRIRLKATEGGTKNPPVRKRSLG